MALPGRLRFYLVSLLLLPSGHVIEGKQESSLTRAHLLARARRAVQPETWLSSSSGEARSSRAAGTGRRKAVPRDRLSRPRDRPRPPNRPHPPDRLPRPPDRPRPRDRPRPPDRLPRPPDTKKTVSRTRDKKKSSPAKDRSSPKDVRGRSSGRQEFSPKTDKDRYNVNWRFHPAPSGTELDETANLEEASPRSVAATPVRAELKPVYSGSWMREAKMKFNEQKAEVYVVKGLGQDWVLSPRREKESLIDREALRQLLKKVKHIHVAGCSTGRQMFNHVGNAISGILQLPLRALVPNDGNGTKTSLDTPEDDFEAYVEGSDGFRSKKGKCYDKRTECMTAKLGGEYCNNLLCTCRMASMPWVAYIVDEDGSKYYISYSWKEHVIDEGGEQWRDFDWAEIGLPTPRVHLVNSGAHALHMIDQHFNNYSELRPTAKMRSDYRSNLAQIGQMMRDTPSCTMWFTMNDFGSFTAIMPRAMRMFDKAARKRHELGAAFRRMAATAVRILNPMVPIIDTRVVTKENWSLDPYHHQNLQQMLAEITLSAILFECGEKWEYMLPSNLPANR